MLIWFWLICNYEKRPKTPNDIQLKDLKFLNIIQYGQKKKRKGIKSLVPKNGIFDKENFKNHTNSEKPRIEIENVKEKKGQYEKMAT